VLGDHGCGTLEHFGISSPPRIIHIGTLSKVLGSFGGFVCGSKLLINFLRHHSHPFRCSTALPESMFAASLQALRLLKSQEDNVRRLKHFSQIARDIFSEYEISFPADFTGIFPLITGVKICRCKFSKNSINRISIWQRYDTPPFRVAAHGCG
jgi:7-keto-8-aminopelargonate synthetase-like enzyme